jgi:hypothetical protein
MANIHVSILSNLKPRLQKANSGEQELYPSVLITNEQDVICSGRSSVLQDLLAS